LANFRKYSRCSLLFSDNFSNGKNSNFLPDSRLVGNDSLVLKNVAKS